MKTKKIKLNILIIALLSLLMNPTNLFAQFDKSWNTSFTETPLGFSESFGFSHQSDIYYEQEMGSLPFSTDLFRGNLMTFNSSLLFSLGGSEGMESGTDTSDNDHIHYANDVPLKGGLLPGPPRQHHTT